MKLTKPQLSLLVALRDGEEIYYSQDGDSGWLSRSRRNLDEFEISNAELQRLRKRGLIGTAPGERGHARISPPEIITDAGRAALREAGRG